MAGLGPRAAVTLPAAAALALLLSFLLLKRRRSKRNSQSFSPDTTACLADSAHRHQEEEEGDKASSSPLAPRPTCAAESHDMRLRDGSKMGDARLSSKGSSRCSTTKTTAGPPAAKTQCAVSKVSPPATAATSECSNAVVSTPTRQHQQQQDTGDVVVAATTAPVTTSVREKSSPPCAVLTVEIPEQRGGGDRPPVLSSEVASVVVSGEDAVCEASPSGSVDSLLGQSSSPPSSTVSPARRESGSESASLLVQDVAALSLAERTTTIGAPVGEGTTQREPAETDAATTATTTTTTTTMAAAEPPQSTASPTADVSPKSDVTENDESVSEDKSQAQALSFSDAHSEGSSDSGKGGSDIHGGSEVAGNGVGPGGLLLSSPEGEELPRTYEFELPRELCGRFIGQGGRNVTAIKSRSNTRIYVHQHPMSSKLKLCSIEGTQEGIRTALELIRKKFPVHAFPNLTLAQVNGGPPHLPGTITLPETLQLRLPDGVTCDVVLTSLVTAGHFFLQQPTHPTYPSLSRLDQCMLTCYGQGLDTPPLPHPVEAGIICAAHVCGGWFRALVVGPSDENEECDIKFLDYGGYMSLSTSLLRQIRSDFMLLPFQASECYLANVQPAEDDNVWSAEACATFEDLAQGQILQALIVGYADNGIPLVYLYRIQGVSSVFINQELVNRGVARWLEHPL